MTPDETVTNAAAITRMKTELTGSRLTHPEVYYPGNNDIAWDAQASRLWTGVPAANLHDID